jgi:CRP-like cAMP-binding protein
MDFIGGDSGSRADKKGNVVAGEALKDNGLLARLPQSATNELGRRAELLNLTRGQVLYEVGDTLTDAYFPTSGMISIVNVMLDGRSVECATIGREGVAGLSIGARAGQAFNRSVVQLSGAALRIPSGAILELAERDPHVRSVFDQHHEMMFDIATQSVACNALHSAERRCARWIATTRDRSDGDELMLTQEFLAEMLGVQRAAVNLAAQQLADANIIEYRRGRITVLDRPALEGRACECYKRLAQRQAFLFDDRPANAPSGI